MMPGTRWVLVFLAVAALSACRSFDGAIAEVTAPDIAGDWQMDAPPAAAPFILVLDPTGRFAVLGEDRVGRWEEEAAVLEITVRRATDGVVERVRLEVADVTDSTLVLEGDSRLAGRYRRVEGRVGHLEVVARYPDKIALPPDARVRVELVNLARTGVSTTPVAAVEFAGGGFVSPMELHLHYLRAGIDPRADYAVAAAVSIGERLWMRTPAPVPALTRGAGDVVELDLVGVQAREAGPGGPGPGP